MSSFLMAGLVFWRLEAALAITKNDGRTELGVEGQGLGCRALRYTLNPKP